MTEAEGEGVEFLGGEGVTTEGAENLVNHALCEPHLVGRPRSNAGLTALDEIASLEVGHGVGDRVEGAQPAATRDQKTGQVADLKNRRPVLPEPIELVHDEALEDLAGG